MIRFFRIYAKPYIMENFVKHLVICLPYVWLIVFLSTPFFIIFKISFTKNILAVPPISDIFSMLEDHTLIAHINLKNYTTIFTDSFYSSAVSSSLFLAFISTIITLIIGFLMAYGIYKIPKKYHYLFLMLVMIPFWISFLIRVYAWMNMLSATGLVNELLLFCNIITSPLHLLDCSFAVCLGIVYCYLPFMILPIYTALEKIDYTYQEAAYDLGATPWQVFWRITVPLSYSGILSGCILVFMPAIGEFVIPELLGGPETFTIGRVVWLEFFTNRDWPMACTLAVIMIIPVIIVIFINNNYSRK